MPARHRSLLEGGIIIAEMMANPARCYEVALTGTSGPGSAASLPRDPAAAESALQSAAVAAPAALGSVASPPQEQLPLQGIVVARPQGPPPLPRDPAAAEPASQSAAVTPPATPGSVPSPSQEPPPHRQEQFGN
jgi:hypothetical protein